MRSISTNARAASNTAAPKRSRKARVVNIPQPLILRPSESDLVEYGSAIIRPDASDTDQFGTPAYVASDFSDGGFTFNRVDFDPMLLDAERRIVSGERNTLVSVHVLDSNGLYDSLPLYGPYDDGTDIAAYTDESDTPHTGLLAATFDSIDPASGAPIVDTASDMPVAKASDENEALADRDLCRKAAAAAVRRYYSGVSLPFKAAADLKRKAPINFSLTRGHSERTAALIAAIVAHCDVQPGTLTFVRGSGRVPGRMLGFTGSDADRTFACGPESGGLSNCIPDRISYVHGETSGAGCEQAVFRLNYAACVANLHSHNTKLADGEHKFSAALALLDMLHNAQPVAASE